jgi:hypothetical protein
VVAVAAFEQGLLDSCEAAAKQADGEVVVDVRLRPVQAAASSLIRLRPLVDRPRGRWGGCAAMDDEAPPVSDEALEAVTEGKVALHARTTFASTRRRGRG